MAGDPPVEAVGITNQRETTVLWERSDRPPGGPGHRLAGPAHRRTPAPRLRAAGARAARCMARTGLVLDPYFSATKIAWLLDHHPGLRARAERGEIAFGTVDSWLAWRLSGGQAHITDVTNASRTLLFDLHTGDFERRAVRAVPGARGRCCPRLVPSSGQLAQPDRASPGIAGRHAAGGDRRRSAGGAVRPGLPGRRATPSAPTAPGAFLLMNIGERPTISRQRLLTSVAWQLDGAAPRYALEGSAFVAGALVQWLRDGLGIIAQGRRDRGAGAAACPTAAAWSSCPALAGLGAPHWRPEARGPDQPASPAAPPARTSPARRWRPSPCRSSSWCGRWRPTPAGRITALRVDGGAAANDLLMQLQADLLGVEVAAPGVRRADRAGRGRAGGAGGGLLPASGGAGAADVGVTRFSPTPVGGRARSSAGPLAGGGGQGVI